MTCSAHSNSAGGPQHLLGRAVPPASQHEKRQPQRYTRGAPIGSTIVTITDSAHNAINREVAQAADGRETGGILLGRERPNLVQITVAGDPGPQAIRTPTSFLRDLDHARSLAEAALAHDQSVWVGEWHTHFEAPAEPSTRDLATCLALLADPELGFSALVAVIITAPKHSQGSVAPGFRTWICDHAGAAETTLRIVPAGEASAS